MASLATSITAPGPSIPGPRIVLIGTSGAGKSTLGNYLLATPQEENDVHEAFSIGNTFASRTTKCQTYPSTAYGWVVTDTPGLGDRPEKEKGEAKEAYESRSQANCTAYFNDITKELHDHGGLILYVQGPEKFGIDSDRAPRHLTAVNKVLHGAFSTGVVLVIRVPPNLMRKTQKKEAYTGWLQERRRDIEDIIKVRFADVLGIYGSHESTYLHHPAHPANFVKLLSVLVQKYYIPAGQTIQWEQVCRNDLDKAGQVRQLEIAIQDTTTKLEQARKELEALQTTKRVALFGRYVIKGVGWGLGEVAGMSMMIPGVGGALGLGAGEVACRVTEAILAILVMTKEEDVKATEKTLEQQKTTKRDIGGDRGAEILAEEAKKLKELVYA